jgi:hypothetical protein
MLGVELGLGIVGAGGACAAASPLVYAHAKTAQANPAAKLETRMLTKDLHPITVDI